MMERSIDPEAVAQALKIFGSGAHIDVSDETIGLLRYANSRVTAQHGEQRLRARIRLERDGKVVYGSLDTLEAEAVQALASTMTTALTDLGAGAVAGDVHIGTPTPSQTVEPIGAEARHALFTKLRDDLGQRALLGGAIRTEVCDRIVAGAEGIFQAETLTKLALQALASNRDGSASVRLITRNPAEISIDGIAEQLFADLAPMPMCAPDPGPCQVVLRPQAAMSLIGTYGYAALGAAGYAAGRTAASVPMGQQIVSEQVTIVDDAHDPDGLPSQFDSEGTTRRRVPLITRGRLTGVVSDSRRAEVTGGRSTGHATPFNWRFGGDPVPTHMLLDAGDATESDLIASCERGLVVSRLDYLRVLHPKDTLVTGTTRDATYWVEGGRIVGRHPAVRFTFRMNEALKAVLAVGKQRERSEQVFMESVVAPGMLIDAGPFTT